MITGYYISGAGHAALILFLLFGGLFTRTPLPPVETADVSIVSEEEFAALSRPETGPQVDAEVAAPRAPEPVEESTVPPAAPEDRPATQEPSAAEAPSEPDVAPEAVPDEPAPEAEVAALPPAEPPAPAPEDAAPDAAEPVPQAAPRVAPDPAPPAPPEAETAPDVIEDTTPAPEPDAPEVVEQEEPAAPPESTTEIVTEAEEPRPAAPASTPRPRVRPERPQIAETPQVPRTTGTTTTARSDGASEPEPDPAPEAPEYDSAVDDALAAALGEQTPGDTAPEAAAPSGPPLTSGEKDALRVAVQKCWNLGSSSSEALATTVVVGMDMTQAGEPQNIRLISSDGPNETAVDVAFEAARRAIVRCGARGFELPVEKYAQWAEIEMTFNPENMRIR